MLREDLFRNHLRFAEEDFIISFEDRNNVLYDTKNECVVYFENDARVYDYIPQTRLSPEEYIETNKLIKGQTKELLFWNGEQFKADVERLGLQNEVWDYFEENYEKYECYTYTKSTAEKALDFALENVEEYVELEPKYEGYYE